MKVIRYDFYNIKYNDEINLYPIGDIHLINKACREDKLIAKINRIKDDITSKWLSMGDLGDFINRSDKRFDPATLADDLTIKDLIDLPETTLKRIVKLIKPIAHQCIGLVEGNHERSIYRHYERNIHSNIVTEIKKLGNFPADYNLDLGVSGWLIIGFHRSAENEPKEGTRILKIWLHHGSSKLSSERALERLLWAIDADLILVGHNHRALVMPAVVETVNSVGKVVNKNKFGCFTGSFLQNKIEDVSTYSEIAGFMSLPLANVVIKVKPFADNFLKAEIEYL